ncbi:MAG: hypothetical protein RL180_88 [Pseudomonadota bacterium]
MSDANTIGADTTSTATTLIHHPYQAPSGFVAMTVPVHKASTIVFDSVQQMRAKDWREADTYTYGLHGTPTTFTLEARIASLEGGQQALLCPSGLSAIAVVNMALLQAGDEVLLPDNIYGPGMDLAHQLLAKFGVQVRTYNPLDAASLACSAHTKLLWIEAAGSITMEFPDLQCLVKQAKAAGVITVLDNTWGAGLAFRPFEFGIDISVHALTKYPSGGADVLMGSIVTRSSALHQRLKSVHGQLGIGIAANDAELVLRGLPTLTLRYDHQDRQARRLALWLSDRTEIAQVLHPALPTSAGHAYWQAVCGDADRAAGLLSVIFRSDIQQYQVDACCNALRLFKIGFSWGGPVSLVMPYDLQAIRPQGAPHLAQGCLVRFAVGLECEADLIADLEQAFSILSL